MRFFIFCFFLLLSACAHIDYNMPVNRFNTPETKGHFFGGELSLAYATSQKVTLAEVQDLIILPIHGTVSTKARIEDQRGLHSRAELGILSRLDAYARGTSDGPSVYGAKIQFIGDPEDKLSPGFKAAISAGYGTMAEEGNQTLSKTYLLSPVSDTYKTKLDVTVKEASLIFGQRLDKTFLFYLDLFGASYRTKASFFQNNVEQFRTDKNSNQYGALVGLRAGEKSSIKVESGIAQAKWGQVQKTTVPIGVSLALGW